MRTKYSFRVNEFIVTFSFKFTGIHFQNILNYAIQIQFFNALFKLNNRNYNYVIQSQFLMQLLKLSNPHSDINDSEVCVSLCVILVFQKGSVHLGIITFPKPESEKLKLLLQMSYFVSSIHYVSYRSSHCIQCGINIIFIFFWF